MDIQLLMSSIDEAVFAAETLADDFSGPLTKSEPTLGIQCSWASGSAFSPHFLNVYDRDQRAISFHGIANPVQKDNDLLFTVRFLLEGVQVEGSLLDFIGRWDLHYPEAEREAPFDRLFPHVKGKVN